MNDFDEGRYYCAVHENLILILEYIGLDRFKCLYDSDLEWTNNIVTLENHHNGESIIVDKNTNILIHCYDINRVYDDYDKMIQDILVDVL